MLYFTRWKVIAILASVVAGILLALPNVLPPDAQKFLAQHTIARPMTLGLDLQGGSNMLLEIDRNDLINKLLEQLPGDIRGALRQARIAYKGINRSANGVTVRLSDTADMEKAREILNNLNLPLDQGLFSTGASVRLYDISHDDLQITFTLSDKGIDYRIRRAIQQSIKIVENRINALGTTEPTIQQQGANRIIVQVPGVQDPQRLKDVLGQTAKLTFQLICDAQPTSSTDKPPPDCKSLPLKEDPQHQLWVQTSSRATIDGADLTDAQPGFDQRSNEPIVNFRFNQKGAREFGKLTAENVGKPFAIVLDDVVVSYPRINEPILGGAGMISGRFTVEEANDLAIVLRSGALPAKLTVVEERSVGPSLGSDSIKAGFIASIVGVAGVLVFMILVYVLFGVFANIALVVNLIFLVAIMSVFGFTLTLPGIAGIVLTLGMAVDSNVLVFERIREEWRHGRSALNAIETGFKAALATVFDVNITHMIAAAVLFGFGSGPIRGFAITLLIGVATTLFTAFTLTRLIVSLWVRRVRPKEVPL
jgi:protein-export membrane protein SecD